MLRAPSTDTGTPGKRPENNRDGAELRERKDDELILSRDKDDKKETNGKLELECITLKGLPEQTASRMDITEERIHPLGIKLVKVTQLG